MLTGPNIQCVTLSLHRVSLISGRPTSLQIYLSTQIQTRPSSTQSAPEIGLPQLGHFEITWSSVGMCCKYSSTPIRSRVLSVECLGDVPIRLTITAGRGEVGGAQRDSIAGTCMPLCVSQDTYPEHNDVMNGSHCCPRSHNSMLSSHPSHTRSACKQSFLSHSGFLGHSSSFVRYSQHQCCDIVCFGWNIVALTLHAAFCKR